MARTADNIEFEAPDTTEDVSDQPVGPQDDGEDDRPTGD